VDFRLSGPTAGMMTFSEANWDSFAVTSRSVVEHIGEAARETAMIARIVDVVLSGSTFSDFITCSG
jgi:hypothetical protein